MLIPQVDFGGEGEQIHLAHANGFHPKMYEDLLSGFVDSYKVNAILFQPFWPGADHRSFKSWKTLGDELIQYFDQQGYRNVIGIGHSMGAIASVLAQSNRPDLFSKLILLEPVILPPKVYYSQLLPLWIRQKMIPPAKIALKRQEHWASKEEAYAQLRPKRVFRDVPDHVFRAYIEYGTLENEKGGVSLSYSKAWEAKIYSTSTNPWPALKSLDIPVFVVRGVNTNVLTNTTWKLLKSRLKTFHFKELEDGGHLVPFEKKSEITKVILDFISA